MVMKGKGTQADPVCDMDISVRGVTYKSDYKGMTYYFCSYECMKKFQDNPEKYLRFRTKEARI